MKDDCLLGNDFLLTMNFDGAFASLLVFLLRKRRRIPFCSRITRKVNRVPQFLRELFERETQDLNEEQKVRFAKFLTEFQDVFSEENSREL